jgi:hypothetical protein
MGMFDGFTGQGDGYTGAQKAGLRRSAGIKKRRKEEERTFEREKMKFGAEEAEKVRDDAWMKEAMKPTLKLPGLGGGGKLPSLGGGGKPPTESKYALQELKGTQAAQAASMTHARGLTTGEIGHTQAMELAKAKSTDPLGGLFSDPANRGARSTLGGEPKSGLVSFLDMDDSKKKSHMDQLKKKDPDAYLDLAKQYKMLNAPEPEMPGGSLSVGQGGRPIYQSDSGTYRNF